MAKKSHRDDDQPKKPASSKKPQEPAKTVPPPEPAIPNMSLDDPAEEPLFVDEVIEEEAIPVIEEVEEPMLLSDEDVIAEEVVEASPASDVFLAEEVEEAHEIPVEALPDDEIIEAQPAEDELLAEEAVLADEAVAPKPTDSPPVPAQPKTGVSVGSGVAPMTPVPAPPAIGMNLDALAAAAAPPSDVDLMNRFDDAPATAPAQPPLAKPIAAAPPEMTPAEPAEVDLLDLFGEETAPAPQTPLAKPIHGEPTAHAEVPATKSAHAFDDEHLFDDENAEPVSDVVAAEEVIEEAGPLEDVEAAEEVIEDAAPVSDIAAAEEVIEEAGPVSDVVAAEEVIEEAAPASDIVAAEEFSEEEAAPVSDVQDAEEVLGIEDIDEAAPASEAKSAELLAEEAEEVSSATRKAEAVIDGDAIAAEIASAVEEAEEAEEVLDAEEAEAVATGSSAVLFDELAEARSGAKGAPVSDPTKKTAEFQAPSSSQKRTVPFEMAPSGTKKSDDELVTEEELVGSSEASAVDLGDMPARKGSSVTGIDKVAEALESGVDLDAEEAEPAAKPEPSVEFDEILEDLGDSDEDVAVPTKGKKAARKGEDADPEMDADALDNLGTIEEPLFDKKKDAKKGKKDKKAKAADDDEVDLESLFGEDEAEPAEAVEDAEDADATAAFDSSEAEAAEIFGEEEEAAEAVEEDEAEAAEAFDEDEAEAEAAEALDEDEAVAAAEDDELAAFAEEEASSSKKSSSKKAAALVDEDEEAEAIEDEAEEEEDEEEVAASKKKTKTIAPPQAQPSMALRWIGGMFVGSFLLAGGAGAGWYFAPEQVKEIAEMSPTYEKKGPVKPPEPTPLEKARVAMDKGDFDGAANLLKNANAPAELNLRGEARWFVYFKQQTDQKAPLDKDAPAVKEAREDLLKGTNKSLLDQIDTTIASAVKEKDLNDQLTKMTIAKKSSDDDLVKVIADKEKAEKEKEAIVDVVVKGKFIDDKSKFDTTVLQKILKDLSDEKTVLDTVNKLLKDAEVKDSGDKGVKTILAEKKDADDKLTAVNKVLDDEKTKDKGAKGILEIVDVRNKTTKERDDLMATISAAFKEFVDGKIVPDNADARKQIVEGAKLARQKAESPLAIPLAQLGMQLSGIGSGTGKIVEKSFDMAKVFSELGFYKTREPFIQTPQEKMNSYMTRLQDRKENNPKELAAISREADWVLTPDSRSDAESRGKARYVQGMALRNQEKFAEALAAFDETLKVIEPVAKVGPWKESVKKSKLELTDPNAYYLPRVEKFAGEGNLKAALDEANTALKVMPAEARLFARRGLIRYELNRGKGAKVAEDDQKAIRADAAAAGKDEKLAAEAAYITGLLEEELGNATEAEKLYRQALKMHDGDADDAGKYRVALGRLLLKDRPEGAAPPAPPAPAEDKKKDDKAGAFLGAPVPAAERLGVAQERTILLHPWTPMVMSFVIGQPQVEEVEDPATVARLKETMELAQELIASKNDKIKGQGHLLLGSALSKLGKRTEGLKEYSKGMQLLYPGMQTGELKTLIDEHPAFQQPDRASSDDPILAERHFGEGIHLYWAKQYPQAEAQFRQAVKYFDKDARYLYYLGLAQYNQRTKMKRDAAYFSWEQGARFEAKSATNPFAVREINASLERVQGEQRQLLNSFRYKAAEEAEAK